MDFFILIRNLAIAIAIFVALLVGLLSAPWQILLIILVSGVVISQWLIERNHLESEIRDIGSLNISEASTASSEGLDTVNSQGADQFHPLDQLHPLALSYRGATYTPSANASEEGTEVNAFERPGKYRGGLSSLHVPRAEH